MSCDHHYKAHSLYKYALMYVHVLKHYTQSTPLHITSPLRSITYVISTSILYNHIKVSSVTAPLSAGLVEKRGICIESCGAGFFVSGGVCEQCEGTCPSGTECDGWNYAEEVEPGDTLDQFINNECAIVNGHIRINAKTVSAYEA